MPRDWRQRGAGFREARQAGLDPILGNIVVIPAAASCIVASVNPVVTNALNGLNITDVTMIMPKLDNVTIIFPKLTNVTMDGV